MTDTATVVSVTSAPDTSAVPGPVAAQRFPDPTPRGTRARYSLNAVCSPLRAELEKFVAHRFSSCYGAAVVEFFPLLLARQDSDQISSVVGLRPGTVRPLFLEQYLDTTLERSIARATGSPVQRDHIMEIGNLASCFRSGNQLMFILLTATLARAEYQWVVFTATAQVRSLLARLQFHTETLCQADQSKLTNKHQEWGSYYQSQPMVQAGCVAEGMAVLESWEGARRLLASHEEQISSLASRLREYRELENCRYD